MQQLAIEQQEYNKLVEKQYALDMKEIKMSKIVFTQEQRCECATKIVDFMMHDLNISKEDKLLVNHWVWRKLKDDR